MDVAVVVVVVVQVVGWMLVVGVLSVGDHIVVIESPDDDTLRLDGDHEARRPREQKTRGVEPPATTERLRRAPVQVVRQHARA